MVSVGKKGRKKKSYAQKGEAIATGDILEEADTGEHCPKGILLFRQIDRINRIQCMQPLDIDLFASSVEALHTMLAPDTEMNSRFAKDYTQLENHLQEMFGRLPKLQQQLLCSKKIDIDEIELGEELNNLLEFFVKDYPHELEFQIEQR